MPGPLGPVDAADGSANASSGRWTSVAFTQLRPGTGGVADGRESGGSLLAREGTAPDAVDAVEGEGEGAPVLVGDAHAVTAMRTSAAASGATGPRWRRRANIGPVSRTRPSPAAGNAAARQGRKNAPSPPPGCMTADGGGRVMRTTGRSVRTSIPNQRPAAPAATAA